MRTSLVSLMLTGCFYATAEKVVVIDERTQTTASTPVDTPDLPEEPAIECDQAPLEAPVASALDTDGDGLSDDTELMIGTDISLIDTDMDGLPDGLETVAGTEPLIPDTDGDALLDGAELAACTDPFNADTDGDTVLDGAEVLSSTDPRSPDTDGDTLLDGDELALGTDPRTPDTDADGIIDGEEPAYGTDPLDADTDDDNLFDGDERSMGTDPFDPDTDRDGLFDGDERDLGTNPLLSDSDLDAIDDQTELSLGTDPTDPDTDGDDLNDGEELFEGSDPLSSDSDGDGLPDNEEVDLGLDPASSDSDGDGVNDGLELELGSDPADPEDTADTDAAKAEWSVRYSEGVMCSTTGAGAGVGLWPLSLGALIAFGARRRAAKLAAGAAVLSSGCYYEQRTVVNGEGFLPEVVEASARCYLGEGGPTWAFDALVEDEDGLKDILAVGVRVFDSEANKPKEIVSLELLPSDEAGIYAAEIYTAALDCTYSGYVAEFIAYDTMLASDPVTVTVAIPEP